jgi:hypothetical protein
MNETTQNQYTDRIKREPCRQENCLSENKDTVEVIILDDVEGKKEGMMCAACLIDN